MNYSYDDESKLWTVKFECDREVDRYDRDDMEEYVIKCSDGKSPPDGGKAQWIEYQKKLSGQGDVVPEPDGPY